MKDEIEALASWFSIVAAASYTFTIGYLDVLKIPINPSPDETFLFYLRATLLSNQGIHGFFRIFGPLLLFILFMKIYRSIRASECCKAGLKALLLDGSALILGLLLISGWCLWSFEQGRNSLNTPTANTFFPEAYREIKTKSATGETSEMKLFRLAWIADKKYFWLDCNQSQPQLIGVEDEKSFFTRRLGPGSIDTICKPGG
jgi:hypothetical protein